MKTEDEVRSEPAAANYRLLLVVFLDLLGVGLVQSPPRPGAVPHSVPHSVQR